MLLAVVVVSYRQTCAPIPNGGGSYEVGRANLGRNAGLVAASALLVDYVMTVAVSVAAGVDNIVSAVPALDPHAVVDVTSGSSPLLAAMNLRGVRESGHGFAIPTYVFIAGVLRDDRGRRAPDAAPAIRPVAESARSASRRTHQVDRAALVFLALRAFASGCTALTGVEAVSNGVPAFKPPKSRNAADTLAIMGGLDDHHVRRHHRPGAGRRRAGRRGHRAPGRLARPATSSAP